MEPRSRNERGGPPAPREGQHAPERGANVPTHGSGGGASSATSLQRLAGEGKSLLSGVSVRLHFQSPGQ